MAFFNWLGTAPIHDPIHGVDHANIMTEPPCSNWKEKAVIRDSIYIWVVRGHRHKDGKRISRYFVPLHPADEPKQLERGFAKRNRALAYANSLGSNDGEHAKESSPTTYITVNPGLGNSPITIEELIKKEPSA